MKAITLVYRFFPNHNTSFIKGCQLWIKYFDCFRWDCTKIMVSFVRLSIPSWVIYINRINNLALASLGPHCMK